MTVAAAALSSLYRSWVAHRQQQVADLVAAGVVDPREVAARLDMTVSAARMYLARAYTGCVSLDVANAGKSGGWRPGLPPAADGPNTTKGGNDEQEGSGGGAGEGGGGDGTR